MIEKRAGDVGWMKKPLAIGIENYKEIIQKKYYYIDKTLLIQEFLEQRGKVNLFIRPKCFGKTLTLSMLKTYFEEEIDEEGKRIDNSQYFHGMKIMEAGEEYTKYMGRYPVISLSLKSAKQPDFILANQIIGEEIAEEFKRHRYILKAEILLENEKKRFEAFMSQRASKEELASSLKFLSYCLKRYHKQNVIILLDEYDVPLENAYFNGFCEEMIAFIRSLFESALKTNDNLEFAVITGCLRISKESIFTGLNNLKIISLLNNQYAEYFGFTADEVECMLKYYDIMDKSDIVKQWYDGYLFGNTEVYNPWSVIHYIDDAVHGASFPKPYWSNTSSNSIVWELIETADIRVKAELETLLAGGRVRKPVHEDITYGEIHESQDNLWNFLFFTGYLKMTAQSFESDIIYLTLTIPNVEIRYIYSNTIQDWVKKKIKKAKLEPLYQAIMGGDSNTFENVVKKYLRESISYYDTKEVFYHGFMIGLLSGWQDYEICSNRESGNGRPDILLKPYDERNPAIIIEIKFIDKLGLMGMKCEEALGQIEDKEYAVGLLEEGYEQVLKYGICFCKKSCMVKKKED